MTWISILNIEELPKEPITMFVFTSNGKYMSFSNRLLTDWLIDKYSITHFMIPEPPKLVNTI